MNSEPEIISQLKVRLEKGVPWTKNVEELVAIFGKLEPSQAAQLGNEELWKLWTATRFAETGSPSLPTPTTEQWPGIRKMTQLLCDRSQLLGERFEAARAVCREIFSADQVQLPVLLRTLLILEGGRFGTVATKSHLNPLLKWAGKPEIDYTKPSSITSALESVGELIDEWAVKVGANSIGERASIAWHICMILKDDSAQSSLQGYFKSVLADYLHARNSQPFSGSNPVCQQFEQLKSAIAQGAAVQHRPNLIVKSGTGKGNWARVPWLALMDSRETDTTQCGVYCVYLFRQDMSGVYLTFNQGVTEVLKQFGRRDGAAALRSRALTIRQMVPELATQGFSLDDDIDLKADPGLGADYETSTIAHKFYAAGAIPSDEDLLADLEAVLGAYDLYLAKPVGLAASSAAVSHWIFQGNPDYFDIEQYVRTRSSIVWQARQHSGEISVGDKVILWRSGTNAGAIAECLVEAAPSTSIADDALDLYLKPPGPDDVVPRCRLKVLQQFVDQPIPRAAVKSALPNSNIIRQPAATNFPLSENEYATILALRASAPPDSSFTVLLRRYHAEQIVFLSSAEKRRYVIASIDADGVDVRRLDANESQRVTFAQAEILIQQVREQGELEFVLLNHTAAVRNTVLQAEPLALTADQKRVVFLADSDARVQNFCALLASMKRENRFYKPAMLLCVLDGIASGALSSNQITFDWIAPRFIALMKSLGKTVTEQQAAQPFYHLSNDLFWLHSVNNLNDLMNDGGDGPGAARNKIKYALLKNTYWNLLQAPAARIAIRHQLETLIRPTPDELLFAAEAAIKDSGFQNAPGLIRRFLASLATKPFVILTGNSGTGKTKLATLLAHWLAGDSAQSNQRYAVVPVGADWTDNRNVVGFVNHLRKDAAGNPFYQVTPVLELLLRATADPEHPYFLILDEMNLSHVERYFSDFLSAMESKKPIPLHQEEHALRTPSGATVEMEIPFPENLFIIGTVNVDETTYMFSPKVLDRANVLEFRIGPEQAKEFLSQSSNHVAPTSPAPGAPLAFLDLSRRARGLAETALAAPNDTTLKECRDSLQGFFDILYSSRLEFAFRTISEITRYLHVDFEFAATKSEWRWQDCMDAQVLQKILPKLHGSRRRLEAILVALATYCEERDLIASQKPLQRDAELNSYPPANPPDAVAFPLSRNKLLEMIEAVRRDQFVSFIQ